MPIFILLDASLSMLAPATEAISLNTANAEISAYTRKNIAVTGTVSFLNYLLSHKQHEFVSTASFSDDVDIIVDFTKDYGAAIGELNKPNAYEIRSKTSIIEAIRAAVLRCVSVWGGNVFCHLVVVSDCNFVASDLETFTDTLASQKEHFDCAKNKDSAKISEGPTALISENFVSLIRGASFALHVVCVNDSKNEIAKENSKILKKLVGVFGNNGTFRFIDDLSPNLHGVNYAFQELAAQLSAPSMSTLKCGSFSSAVQVMPALRPIRRETDFEIIEGHPGDYLEVFGFLRPADLGSPPVVSRHLLLAVGQKSNAENLDPFRHKSAEDDKTPNFCILLHGALKVEDVVAVCEIGPNWYGYVYHIPNAKRSNLVLHCFEPGVDAVPWLGNLNSLATRPYSEPAPKGLFPVPFKTKPSYGSSYPNWIHSYGLQADVQKVLRYARKLPEKALHFEQELNRICHEALGLGFVELFAKLAHIFETELLSTPADSAHAKILRNAIDLLISQRIKFGEPVSVTTK